MCRYITEKWRTLTRASASAYLRSNGTLSLLRKAALQPPSTAVFRISMGSPDAKPALVKYYKTKPRLWCFFSVCSCCVLTPRWTLIKLTIDSKGVNDEARHEDIRNSPQRNWEPFVKIRPQKACNYPNLRSLGWVKYDEVGVSYSGKLGNRSEARASDLRSYPGFWVDSNKATSLRRQRK